MSQTKHASSGRHSEMTLCTSISTCLLPDSLHFIKTHISHHGCSLVFDFPFRLLLAFSS